MAALDPNVVTNTTSAMPPESRPVDSSQALMDALVGAGLAPGMGGISAPPELGPPTSGMGPGQQQSLLNRGFEALDTDGDGRISRTEFEFAEMDADGSGAFSFEEFMAFKSSGESMFDKYDKDGDGYISKEEFEFALMDRDGDGEISPEELVFHDMDANGDGIVSPEEFNQAGGGLEPIDRAPPSSDWPPMMPGDHERPVALDSTEESAGATVLDLIASLDTDDSGATSTAEVLAGIDADGDGMISVSELLEWLLKAQTEAAGAAGGQGSGRTAADLIASLDGDGGGTVSVEEVSNALESGASAADGIIETNDILNWLFQSEFGQANAEPITETADTLMTDELDELLDTIADDDAPGVGAGTV